jgi:glycerol-3-phosphate dehydrogenase (NAD(P)+)
MARLGTAMGGELDTLLGLSGLGDLVLTAGSAQSRNMSLGRELGRGRALSDILAERRSVSEGVTTASAVADLGRRLGIDMPIAGAVDGVVSGRLTVKEAVTALLARPPREEGVHGRSWTAARRDGEG